MTSWIILIIFINIIGIFGIFLGVHDFSNAKQLPSFKEFLQQHDIKF